MDKLGNMYYYGNGVNQDYRAALYWLENAVSKGCYSAAYLIGEYYKSENKFKESAKWHRIYAEYEIKQRNKRLGREK